MGKGLGDPAQDQEYCCLLGCRYVERPTEMSINLCHCIPGEGIFVTLFLFVPWLVK
jgi:hypothetical protein